MFINPLEILDIDNNDKDSIKRAKRRLIREMDLEDGIYQYHGEEITTSQVESAIDKIDTHFNAFRMIKNLPKLNKFLITGKLEDNNLYFGIKDYEGETAYNFEIEALISRDFAEKIGLYLKNYDSIDGQGVENAMMYIDWWVSQEHKTIAYNPMKKEIEGSIDRIKEDIKSKGINPFGSHGAYDTYVGKLMLVKRLPIKSVAEKLPSFFDSVLNDLAWKVRNWLVDSVNEQTEGLKSAASSRDRNRMELYVARISNMCGLGVAMFDLILEWNCGDDDKFNEEKETLEEMETRYAAIHRQAQRSYSSVSGSSNQGCLVTIAIGVILTIASCSI